MRKLMTAGLLGGLVAWLGGGELSGQTTASSATDSPAAEVARLIKQLGAPDFIQRQQAMTQLSGLGRPVVEPLRHALQSDDAEVRQRAAFVLQLLRASDRDRVLEAFLAGDDPGSAAELPGWAEFQTMVGDAPGARPLYAQMLQDEATFLDAVFRRDAPDAPPADVSRELATRTWELHQQLRSRQVVPISSVSALLLVAAGHDVDLASQSGLMTLCYRSEFDRAIRGGPEQAPLKRMLGRVVAKDSDESLLAQRLHFTLNYELAEGLDPARAVLGHRVGNPHIRQYAILVVAKMGRDAEDTRILEQTLEDGTEIAALHRLGDRQITTQLGDVALASLVHRAGESLADYGLADVRLDATLVFQTISVGFASDADRRMAMDRWRTLHAGRGEPGKDESPSLPVDEQPAASQP